MGGLAGCTGMLVQLGGWRGLQRIPNKGESADVRLGAGAGEFAGSSAGDKLRDGEILQSEQDLGRSLDASRTILFVSESGLTGSRMI